MTDSGFDPYVERVLVMRGFPLAKHAPILAGFSRWVLTEVEAQAAYTDRYARPALETYGKDGSVVNRVVVNERYERQHQELYRRGMIGLPYAKEAPHLLSFTMGYLLAQSDISLHCPATLTGAVAYVLGYHAPEAIRRATLHELVRMDGQAKSGGTWATEPQGGSDLGATTTRAERDGTGFRLYGVKWFASNAGGDLALATARPSGAAAGGEGLGLYLVPRRLEDGTLNHYTIRRLKEKLGTRGLPTGEIELHGAAAVEIAPPPLGLKTMMEALEYSRIHNAVGAAGTHRRALREALEWAKSRVAFGRTLLEHPTVREQLLAMRVRYEASTLLAFEPACAFDEALRDAERRRWMRMATALAKYLTAEEAIRAARGALELVGGNGYTGDSPTERLLRDAQVLTVWEGPANIQALELARMLGAKHGGERLYERRMLGIAARLTGENASLRKLLDARLAGDLAAIDHTMASPESADLYGRRLLHRLSQSLGFGLMCEMAADATPEEGRHFFISARRYHEEIEPPEIGEERAELRQAALELLEDEHRGARP